MYDAHFNQLVGRAHGGGCISKHKLKHLPVFLDCFLIYSEKKF